MAVASELGLSPPQISFKTFENVLDRLKNAVIPERIDRNFWGPFLGGTYGTQLIAALRFFQLIDADNRSQDQLRELAEGDRKAVMAALLREHYAPIFNAVNLERSMPGHLDEAFRKEYKVNGDGLRRARTFFVHASKFSGIPLSSYITEKTRVTSSATRRKSGPRKRRSDEETDTQNGADDEIRHFEEPGDSGNGETPRYSRHALMAEYLKTMPFLSEGWGDDALDQWLQTFKALVRVIDSTQGN